MQIERHANTWGRLAELIEMPSQNKYSNLAKIKKLQDEGAITLEEYERKKANILN